MYLKNEGKFDCTVLLFTQFEVATPARYFDTQSDTLLYVILVHQQWM